MVLMETEAPNFRGTYPLAGERIGPAWREMWAHLASDKWTEGITLAHAVAESHGLAVKTVRALLWKAAKEGILMQKDKYERSRTRKYYKVATKNLNV